MTLFWILALALVGLAVLFVIIPLLYFRKHPVQEQEDVDRKTINLSLHKSRLVALDKQLAAGELNQPDYESQRRELEKDLLADMDSVERESTYRSGILVPVVFAVLVPLLAFGLYFQLGAIDQVGQKNALAELSREQDPAQALIKMEKLVKNFPDDYQSRYMLAGMYMSSGKFDEAVSHYRIVIMQVGEQAEPLAQLAQALFIANDNEVSQEVDVLVRRALISDPDNTTALGLKGISAYEQGEYRRAITTWEKLLPMTRNAQARDALRAGIARAREALGEDVSEVEEGASVQIQVSLDKALQELPPQTRVFVYARAQFQKMPLAIAPLTVGDLPGTVILDDSMMMMEGLKLSDYKLVDIIVRVSIRGSVMEPDYEALLKSVEVNSQRVSSVIVGENGS